MIYNVRKLNNKEIPLNPNTRQNRYLLSIGVVTEYGENYNGYGYADHVRVYVLDDKQMQEYDRLGKIQSTKKKVTEEEKIGRWARRLDRLTGCGIDRAEEIVKEKIQYHNEKIEEMNDRQFRNGKFSERRQKLIDRMSREDPLRYIQNAEHAQAILEASRRHNSTDYEMRLEEARELVEMGRLDAQDKKEWARSNMR